MLYVIDTSAIVDAWRKWYSPDSIPGFWDKLDNLAMLGEITLPDAVLLELQSVEPDLYRWCKDREEYIITPSTSEIQNIIRTIAREYPNLQNAGAFASNFADPIVIAVAEHNGGIVITHEKATGNINGPNIPDVCRAKNIRVIQIHHLVHEQRWIFG
jgi:hypothetical protein